VVRTPTSPTPHVPAPLGSARGDTIRAYIALTKPRIIELLLITTVPAMVLATRDLPGTVDWIAWGWLVLWPLVAARSRPAAPTP
jgi:protoheme IX farnesyltransferase